MEARFIVGKMSPAQEAHLAFIKTHFSNLVDKKYRKGAKEHGGDLWGKDQLVLLDAAIDEAIDQVTYLLTLRDRIR
jgi:hypothetical protein